MLPNNLYWPTIENNQVCSAIFLDIAQWFDKVWRQDLLSKL